MATTLNKFNTQQDAVTIFLDATVDTEDNLNEAPVEEYFRDVFAEGEFVYDKDLSIGGQKLFALLRNKYQSGEMIPLMNNRMIVCYFMDLEMISDEWITSFFEQAEELKRFVPERSIYDQHYIICFRYSAGEILEQEKKDKINSLLIRLASEYHEVSRQVYLLRKAGFAADFVSQEKAVVRLLHLLSRRDYLSVFNMNNQKVLRMIDSSDYYTARAENCSRIIREVEAWQNGATDPNLEQLMGQMRIQMQTALEALQGLLRNYRRRESIYPVNVKNFEGNFLRGYHSTIGRNHPIMKELFEEYIGKERDKLIHSVNFSEGSKLIRETYHYPDYKQLQEAIKGGQLRDAMVSNNPMANDDEKKAFLDKIYTELEGKILPCIPNIEQLWKTKETQKRKSNQELTRAGRYSSLEDCFARIESDTQPQMVAGVYAREVNTIALVSGDAVNNWALKGYDIKGIISAYRYLEINPYEIFLMKESELLDLGEADAANKLNIIY